MITWSAHLIPSKNIIRFYRRTNDLTQVRNVEATNRKSITHAFSSLHMNDVFEEAEKILQETGHTLNGIWRRDQNFEIWYINVSEEHPELI